MYTIIIFFSFLIVLIVVAKLSEDKITDIAVKKVSAAVKAPMEIDDVSFTLLRRFPLATVEFNGVWLGSPITLNPQDSSSSIVDTLAKIEHLYVSVRSLPLIKKKFEVMKVEIRKAYFKYLVDSSGTSNFDFLIDTTLDVETDTVTTPLNILLKNLVLKEIVCNYSDNSLGVKARLQIPQIKIKGEAENNIYNGSARGSIILTDCNMEGTNLYKMQETEVKFDCGYADDSVSIDELKLVSDGIDLNVSGSLFFKDEMSANISITEAKLNIGELIKYAPEQMLKDYGIKNVSGNLNLDAQINGIVSDSILPHIDLDLAMLNGNLNTTDYPMLKNINFIGHITNGILNNNQTTSLDFKTFHFETDQSKFDIEFSLQDIDHPKYNVKTNLEIVLSEFKDFIPDSVAQNVSGRINASLSTKGQLPDSISSDFIDYLMETSRADIDIRNLNADLDSSLSIKSFSGQVAYKPKSIALSNLYASIPSYKVNIKNSSLKASIVGKLSQPNSMAINFSTIRFIANGIELNGKAKVRDLENPQYDLNTILKLDLEQVKELLPDTLVNKLSGVVRAKIESAGKIKTDSITEQINDLLFESSSIRLWFINVLAEMPDTLMSIDKFSGKVFMKPDTIAIDDMHGIFSGIEFKIDSTKISNLYNTVIKNQAERLFVQCKIDLGDLNYNMFLPFIPAEEPSPPPIDTVKGLKGKVQYARQLAEMQNTPEPPPPVDSVPTNWRYLFKGKISINSFTYNKALVENISAKFNITDTMYIVDQFKFNAFEGKHNTSVKYSIKDNEQTLSVKNSVRGMNVNQLLKDFDNFKEYYEPAISYENISGILTSRLDAQILMRNDSMIMDKFFVRADTIKLEKGGIYNYPAVQDVAQYLPGIDNLDKLEFKTINSQVFILQGAIYVPKTVIISNKLDASALGMQSFGEDYSYHFEVFIRDILSGKSKKTNKKQEKSGDEVATLNRKGTLVKSYSIDGKSRSGLDNKNDRDKMKITVSAAHTLLKLKFYPKLVKYDTGVK